MSEEVTDPAATARALMRSIPAATLGTVMHEGAAPYVSLTMVALAHDASPVLLLSKLSDHTRNIEADPRVSLLFDGTVGRKDRMSGPRVAVQGRVQPAGDARLGQRYLARHPAASLYAGFADFGFHTVTVERAHLIAGFGQAFWIEGADLLLDSAGAADLAEQEPDIIRHMNDDHGEAVDVYAHSLLGLEGAGWTMTGIDPEGADLRYGGAVARLAFDRRVTSAADAREQLVRLAREARSREPAK